MIMVVTPEQQNGDLKIFEFESSRSCSVSGHGVTVYDRPTDNCLLKNSSMQGGRYITLSPEVMDELRDLIEEKRPQLGSGKTEEVINSAMFVLDGYGTRFYFCDGIRAIRSYICMAGEYMKMPKEEIPQATAVLELFKECAHILKKAGVDRRYFALIS